MLLFPLFALSLLCPFLIFLDYHKRANIHISILYVSLFYGILFLFSLVVFRYGLFLAAAAPILLLILCIIKKK